MASEREREIAHGVYDVCPKFARAAGDEGSHSEMCDRLTAALGEVRDEALEEAAKHVDAAVALGETDSYGSELAKVVRSLKRTPPTERTP